MLIFLKENVSGLIANVGEVGVEAYSFYSIVSSATKMCS